MIKAIKQAETFRLAEIISGRKRAPRRLKKQRKTKMKKNIYTENQNFGKKNGCPAAENILTYIEGKANTAESELMCLHLDVCDYCRAEFFFLTYHPPVEQTAAAAVEMPSALRQLAESLLKTPKKQTFDLAQMLFSEEQPLSTNFQMQ